MKKYLLVVLIVISSISIYAQKEGGGKEGNEFFYQSIAWEDEPVWEQLDTSYQKEQEVGLIYNRIVEFIYAEEYEGRLVEYFTVHKKIRVYSDDAVQSNNKVYIGMGSVIELIEAKARVITPDGEIIEFDESNMLDSKGEDGSVLYKYFAIDGIVEGADVEYSYTVMRLPSYNGRRLDFQNDIHRKNINFTLASPSNLSFAIKSYNGLDQLLKDEKSSGKNVYSIHLDSVAPMVEEDYSAYAKNLLYLVYKLDENEYNGSTNLVNYGEVSQNIYNYYYSNKEKKDVKSLKKFINGSGAFDEQDEVQKIRLVEAFLKKEIGVIEEVNTKTMGEIISDGYTSENGLILLMIQSFKILGIKHEIVLTCNRYEDYFDEDFESYDVLDNVFLYFPKQKKYLVPQQLTYRFGLVPDKWTAQNGLFIKEVTVGDMSTGLGKVKFIKALSADLTADNMDVFVDFSDVALPVIEFERELSGYSSTFFQSLYNLFDDDTKKEIDESLILFADSKGEVIEYTLSGVDDEDFGVNPMIYKGKIQSASIMEKAGNKFIFKVGELIGPQMEMYQDEERLTDIEHSHNMEYKRVIRFEIPDGYELSGLDKLKINEFYPAEKPTIRFSSEYTVEGSMVTITVIEHYDEVFFTKEEIDDFRRIINAAANFNKIVLFLTKK